MENLRADVPDFVAAIEFNEKKFLHFFNIVQVELKHVVIRALQFCHSAPMAREKSRFFYDGDGTCEYMRIVVENNRELSWFWLCKINLPHVILPIDGNFPVQILSRHVAILH